MLTSGGKYILSGRVGTTKGIFWRASPASEVIDVYIIGAGVVGCAIARHITLASARVAVIEKAAHVLKLYQTTASQHKVISNPEVPTAANSHAY